MAHTNTSMRQNRTRSGYLKPTALKSGDRIGVIAPSSPQRDDDRLRKGIEFLSAAGFEVVEGKHLWNRYGYLAGRDQERLDDLNRMIRDPSIRMIIAGRGGYGTTRILEGVDYQGLKEEPKVVVGFSDVTALNLAFLARSGVVTFSGAMPGVDFFDDPDEFAVDSFFTAIGSQMNGDSGKDLPAFEVQPERPGIAVGPLIPANLTLLASLCGTPYLPDFAGSILLIEEIGEEAYRVDRLLSQLHNSGAFSKLVGLALGAFTGSEPKRISVDPLPIEEVFNEYLDRFSVPAVSHVPYGHIPRKATLPLGVECRIDGSSGSFELLERGVVLL